MMRNMTFLPSTQIVGHKSSLLLLLFNEPVADFFGLGAFDNMDDASLLCDLGGR